MCFHQPAPNDGEDGRLLLLLLSALHFINLKSLFVVVVAADITHLKAQASLWIAGSYDVQWKAMPRQNATLQTSEAGKCVEEKRDQVFSTESAWAATKQVGQRTLASLPNHQLVIAWLGTWLLFLQDHLGGSFLLIFLLQQSADEPLRVTWLTSFSDETILPIFLLRPKMF